jgi:CRP/FNR family cyclic AMP-dependent transcriptional regulator
MSDPLFLRFGREFRAGDVLFREGERGEEMYAIQSGVVQVFEFLEYLEMPRRFEA